MSEPAIKKIVLCFSGLDPSGGAGIQADIEAIAFHGAHAASIVTALTVQNTCGVKSFESVSAKLIVQQAECILNDMPVAAIKIGMLGSVDVVQAVFHVLQKNPSIPVIFDPVLAAGGGEALARDNLIEAMQTYIIPNSFVITPNTLEAESFTKNSHIISAQATELLQMGAQNILITGTHADTDDIVHQLFSTNKTTKKIINRRLNNEYHGSGCTLAASLAAFIAQHKTIDNAVELSLHYTYRTLQQAQHLGKGQLMPNRVMGIKI